MGVGEKGAKAKSIQLQIPSVESCVFLLPSSMGKIALQQLRDSISLLPTVAATRRVMGCLLIAVREGK